MRCLLVVVQMHLVKCLSVIFNVPSGDSSRHHRPDEIGGLEADSGINTASREAPPEFQLDPGLIRGCVGDC